MINKTSYSFTWDGDKMEIDLIKKEITLIGCVFDHDPSFKVNVSFGHENGESLLNMAIAIIDMVTKK